MQRFNRTNLLNFDTDAHEVDPLLNRVYRVGVPLIRSKILDTKSVIIAFSYKDIDLNRAFWIFWREIVSFFEIS